MNRDDSEAEEVEKHSDPDLGDEFDPDRVAAAISSLAASAPSDEPSDLRRSHDLTALELVEVEHRIAADPIPVRQLLQPDVTDKVPEALELLLRRASRYPLLKPHEEVELAKAIERGSLAAKERFLLSNIRLVVAIATEHQGRGLELDDLVQAGMIGLNRAVEKYDWRLGFKFSTYATWWIRQSIQREIDNTARLVRLPVHIAEQVRTVRGVVFRLIGRSGREPSVAAIARAAKLSPGEVDLLLRVARDALSLDVRVTYSPESPTRGETLEDSAPPVLDQVLTRDVSDRVREAVAELPERQRTVLDSRFGLGTDEPWTLEAVGLRFGITRERVRQIQDDALKVLEARFRQRGLA